MVKLAKVDARNFRLDKDSMEDFRKSGKKYQSKYFEPKIENVPDPKLLKDPDYLQAYRDAVFDRTKRRRTPGHYILIAGVVYVGLAIVALLLLPKFIENVIETSPGNLI